jgi:hypothetical protein
MQTRPMEAASAVRAPGAYVDGGRQETMAGAEVAESTEEDASQCLSR